MKSPKKMVLLWMAVIVFIGFGSTLARAELIVDDWNWADSVAGYSANIQNYGGTVMSGGTMWWLSRSHVDLGP